MKKAYFIYILSFFVLSCDSLVEGLNVDPNNPTEAPADIVLTGAEVGAILVHEGAITRQVGMWSGYLRGVDRQNEGIYGYLVNASNFSAIWEDIFINLIRNARIAELQALEDGKSGIILGIAKVLQAQGYGLAASLWGDIPYTDAVDFENNRNPAYDSQVSVYEHVQALLDAAIQDLQAGTGRPSRGSDIFFDGDPQKWIEVAYTLKARYYLHRKQYGDALQSAMLGISSREGSMMATHGTATDGFNLFYQFFTGGFGDDINANGTLASSLLNPTGVSYRGNAKTDESGRFGYFLANTGGVLKPNITDGMFAASSPFPIISYEENQLIWAETAFRVNGFEDGLNRLNAYRSYLHSGANLPASFQALGVKYETYESGDFEFEGILNSDGSIDEEEALLREILVEKFISLFCQIENFNDMRRTLSETSIRVPIKPNVGTLLPQRFLYPQTEIDRNSHAPTRIPGLFEATPINK